MTKYMGLIGYPLGHSVSPAMHRAAFGHYKLDNISVLMLPYPIRKR